MRHFTRVILTLARTAIKSLPTLVGTLSLTPSGCGLQVESLGDVGELKAKGVPGKLEVTQLSELTEVIQSLFRWSGWEVGSPFSEALGSAELDRA